MCAGLEGLSRDYEGNEEEEVRPPLTDFLIASLRAWFALMRGLPPWGLTPPRISTVRFSQTEGLSRNGS